MDHASKPSDPAEIFLRCDGLLLRPLRAADTDGPYRGWLNDPEVCRQHSHHVHPYHREDAAQYIEASRRTRAERVLSIEDAATGRHIGNVALQRIHAVDRSAEFSIRAIEFPLLPCAELRPRR